MVVSNIKMNARQYFMLGEDPPGVRLELVDGEIAVSASPTPNHANLKTDLTWLLADHIRRRNLGKLLCDVDIHLDDYNVRRPDIFFFFSAHLDRIGERYLEGAPDLAIEVITPSSVEIDPEDKFEQYRESMVPYYWIVDPTLKTFEGWQLRDGEYVAAGMAQGVATIRLPPFPDLEIPLRQLWLK